MSINIREITEFLIAKGIHFDSKKLENILVNHPEYPSLLSISDSFSQLGINHVNLKIKDKELGDLPDHFLALIKESGVSNYPYFSFIKKKDNYFVLNKKNIHNS